MRLQQRENVSERVRGEEKPDNAVDAAERTGMKKKH